MRIFGGAVLGLIVGSLLGGILFPGWGLGGWLGLLGLVGGGWLAAETREKASSAAAGGEVRPGSLAGRVASLEAQVDWLYRESLALRREVTELRGAGRPGEAANGAAGEARGAPATSATPVAPVDIPLAAQAVSAAAAGLAPPAPAAVAAAAALSQPVPAMRGEVAAAAPPVPAERIAVVPGDATSPAETTSGVDAAASTPPVPPLAPEPSLEAPPEWWSRLLAGNPLAKIGVVLLFFGVASALRLVVEYGWFPVPLRLFLAAAGGVGLIAFGLRKATDPQRQNFGLAIQGGGFALLYLVVYFMLARYAMLGAGAAFALFAVLGVSCVAFAARQDGPALAVFGMTGAFLAPLLAGGRADSPLLLFSYFALLNVFILAVDWFRAWRVLNIAGFLFTLVIGMAWAVDGYRPAHYLVTQCFLVLFAVMYSAMPVAAALLRAPGFAGWRDAMLVFGTPLAGAFLQARLMRGVPYGLAWSALFASLYYFVLWAALFRRRVAEAELIERSHLGLAITFLTVSVPLAFGAQVTSAFWAAEGAAVLWFGTRMKRTLAQATGLGMQFLGGIALIVGWHQLDLSRPLVNDAVLGGALLAAAGIASARLLRRLGAQAGVAPVLPFVWALLWWFGVGFDEIRRFTADASHPAFALLFTTASVLLIEALAVGWRWPQVRLATLLLLPAMWLATVLAVVRSEHPLAGFMVLALPLAFVVNSGLLIRYLQLGGQDRGANGAGRSEAADAARPPGSRGAEKEGEEAGEGGLLIGVRHVGGWWLALLALPLELSWVARELAPGVDLWPLLAWGSVTAASLWFAAEAVVRRWWVFAAEELAIPLGAVPPTVGLVFWSVFACLNHAGGGSGLPYLPLLNFFDLLQLTVFAALLRVAAVFGWSPWLRPAVGALAFLWLSTLAGRIVHHWAEVPFTWHSLWASNAFQALLTLFWTVTAIATMIRATRTVARPTEDRRTAWFAGMTLLAVVGGKLLLVDAAGSGTLAWTATLIGVAVLVLAAGYFAPLPPKDSGRQAAGTP